MMFIRKIIFFFFALFFYGMAQASGSVSLGTESHSTTGLATNGLGVHSISGCTDKPTRALLNQCGTDFLTPAFAAIGRTVVCGGLAGLDMYCQDNVGWAQWYPTTYIRAGCPPSSTGTTSCTCNSGYVPSADAKSCVSDCPHKYLGIPVSGGFAFTTASYPDNYLGCDNFGCEIEVGLKGRVFGVSLYENTPVANQCPNTVQPTNPPVTTLTVSFADPVAPEKTKFDDVVQKAADAAYAKAVQDAKILSADTAAKAAKEAVDRATATLNQLQTAAAEKNTAAQNVRDAAAKFAAYPTVENLTSYNQTVQIFNQKSLAVQPVLTAMDSQKKIAQAAVDNSKQVNAELSAMNEKLMALKVAVDASGQPFDATQITERLGQLVQMQQTLSDALAKIGTAESNITTTNNTVNNLTNQVINNNTTVNNTTILVQQVASGLPPPVSPPGGGEPTPIPAVEPPVTPEPPPTLNYCETHPMDASCLPASTPIPTDYARQGEAASAAASVITAMSSGVPAASAPSDLDQAMTDFENLPADIRAVADRTDLLSLPNMFQPFNPQACQPLSWAFAPPGVVSQTISYDICSKVDTIKRITSYFIYLLTAILLFQMFTRRPEGGGE